MNRRINLGLVRLFRSRTLRLICLAVAGWPVFQTTGCIPDPLGALNFELQLLINTTLINAVNVIVQNVLRL